MRPIQLVLAVLTAILLVHCSADDARREPLRSQASGAEVCVAEWNPTWQQRSGANNWWVEYAITGGTVASAYLEVVGGSDVPLTHQGTKWVGPASTRIATGASVIVHAQDSLGKKAQTEAFGYLSVTQPLTDPCGGGDPGDGCAGAWDPSWQQGDGANYWWVEYAISGDVTAAYLEVVGVGNVPLSLQWDKWVGESAYIAEGASVIVHATNAAGASAQTSPFGYLVETHPLTKPCDGGPGGEAPATPGEVYDPSKVFTYELSFDAAAMAVLSSTAEADRKTWVHGSFSCAGTALADVGVRRKGSSTFRALPQKAALKIRFDKYVAGQRFAGLTDLTLNNAMSDPTFLVERLSYHVFRSAGLPAQRASSAQIVINGAPYGLYVNVETPNEQLIDRLFGGNKRTLYEIEYGSQWLPGVEDGFDEEVGDGSKDDVSALFAAVQQANDATLLADVAGHLDTDEWLGFSATEAVIGDYDGYAFGNWGSHNYFMAGDVNGVFSLIPWSTDLTMSERAGGVDASDPKDVTGGGPTLLGRCKQSATCWATYKDRVRNVLAVYEGLSLVSLAQTWHAQIDALVVADPKRETSLSYYDSETTKLYGWLGARPGVVRGQLGIAP